jgi:flagellar biosynthetic protein FliP
MKSLRRLLAGVLLFLLAVPAMAMAAPGHGIQPDLRPAAAVPHLPAGLIPPNDQTKTADVVRIVLILTLMAVLPAVLVCMTSFVRIVVVLSMIRHAFGMPETPPNQVLVSLAIFLTLFSMAPTFTAVNGQALQPFLDGQLTVQQAIDRGSGPARGFMLRQVRDSDIKVVYDISRKPIPDRASDVSLIQLIPAFMLNELRVAFRIGFVVMLPFLLIDLVVSSILLALGMLMVPPSTLSLPIKVLMFVLIDGWSLVLQGVLGSFR